MPHKAEEDLYFVFVVIAVVVVFVVVFIVLIWYIFVTFLSVGKYITAQGHNSDT